jgi:hypothetical protein
VEDVAVKPSHWHLREEVMEDVAVSPPLAPKREE